MTLSRLVILIVLVAAGLGYWAWGGPRGVVNSPPRPGPIVAFGDSLTQGAGAGGEQNSYPAVLSHRLGRPVSNAGIGGNKIADGARRLPGDVLRLKPGVVIVLLGGNDLLGQQDLDQSFRTLEALVQRIQAGGAMVVLVGINGLSPVGGLGGRYARVAKRTGALYVPDVLDGIFMNSKMMTSDMIHPNAKGYALMAERIGDALEPYVRE